MELKRKKELLEALKTIPDYRVDTGKIKYPLHEVLFMTLFALIQGNTIIPQEYQTTFYKV